MAKASSKKKKNPQYRSVRGTAMYPRIDSPDTKYNKHGDYKVTLRLEGEAAEKQIAEIQKIAVELTGEELPVSDAIVKVKGKYQPNEQNSCFQPDFDRETGEMTGAWNFFFKAKSRMITDRKTKEEKLWDRKPRIFSASGKLVKSARIGGGTELAVIFEVYAGETEDGAPFMNLQPVAVQVYKLVEWKPGTGVDSDLIDGEDEGWEPEDDDSGDEDSGIDGIESGDDDTHEGEDDF